jgi:hypothetical protein
MCMAYIPANTRKVSEIELSEYLSHFSKEVSEDIKRYATDEIFLESRYIFTYREARKKMGFCTHCKNSFSMDGIAVKFPVQSSFSKKKPSTAECPHCKSKCITKASGRGRSTMIDEGYFVYYEKSQVDPEAIVAMGIYAARDYRGDYTKVDTVYAETAIYIFKMGKSLMLKRYAFYSNRECCIKVGEYERCKKVHSLCEQGHFASISTGFSKDSVKQSIKNTPFQYSTWDSYILGTDFVKFFDFYSKSPCIEYFTKMGLQNLVRGKLEGESTYSAINWRGKTIFKALKITKQELREIKYKKMYISFLFLKIMQESKKNNWGLSIVDVKDIEASYGEHYFNLLQLMLKYGSMKKIFGYLSKQYSKNIKQYYSKSSVLTDWRDYIEDCKKLGLDINQEYVLYPKNLYNAHQNTISQIKAKANKELDVKITARLKDLRKYDFSTNDFIIRPVVSTSELINEGKELNHCVGNYADKYAAGTTNILVIRKVNEPDKPYFTLEFKGNEVIQVRGFKNCKTTKEVQEFVDAFTDAKLEKKSKSKVKKSA